MSENPILIIDDNMVAAMMPARLENSNKGDYGKLLNICGSKTMVGAAMMSTLAAMRMGAGTTTLASTEYVIQCVAAHLMEAMTIPLQEGGDGEISADAIKKLMQGLKGKTACLIGCGLSLTENTQQIVEYIVENTECKLILDADGLNAIAKNPVCLKKLKSEGIIAPHIGEMARLAGKTIAEVKAAPIETAAAFAKENKVVVVLKDHVTYIATSGGMVYENHTGNAGLAKGGSGDVLAGMIAGLLAQGISPAKAAVCAVYKHGKAADELAKTMPLYRMMARDIISTIN